MALSISNTATIRYRRFHHILNRKRPAKRALFELGVNDPKLNMEMANRLLSTSADSFRQRWNFDPITATPMEGKYNWSSVKRKHDDTEVNTILLENVPAIESSARIVALNPDSKRIRLTTSPDAKDLRQSKITDFIKIKKKTTPISSKIIDLLLEKSVDVSLQKSVDVPLQKSVDVTLGKSVDVPLEKSVAVSLEKSEAAEV